MPAFDKTGPQGQGSMTGRRFGPCGTKDNLRNKFNRGFGLGRRIRKFWGQNKENKGDLSNI